MKKVILLVLAAACILFEACRKVPQIEFGYTQTYCADPWLNGPDDAATIASVRTYLQSQNLSPTSIRIETRPTVEQCNACTCKTGVIILVTDKEERRERYTQLRFFVR